MFNLLVSNNPEAWDSGLYSFRKERVFEDTQENIQKKYESFKELVNFPSLFVVENEKVESRIGYIDHIEVKNYDIVISFNLDEQKIPKGKIEKIANYIDMFKSELSRTHWAIKDKDLWNVLIQFGYITEDKVQTMQDIQEQRRQLRQIFVVHGHDEITKNEVADFIRKVDLDPIILDMEANGGKTIIEKLECYTKVNFGVVLYTQCDVGAKKGDLKFSPRARQNVVFEHGYLIAKLGRDKVAAIVKGDVEMPSDIQGLVYIPFDKEKQWEEKLKKELSKAEYKIR